MSEPIYIQKPEDVINLSPDKEHDIAKDKNQLNDKHKQNENMDSNSVDAPTEAKMVNNNEEKKAEDTGGNYYVKEPGNAEEGDREGGSQESLNSGYHSSDIPDVDAPDPDVDLDLDDGPQYANEGHALVGLPDDDAHPGHDTIPLEPLALDESFEENSRRLVEIDDEGNTLRTHSRIPSKYAKGGATPKQNAQTEHLLQALARLDLDTIPTESQDIQPANFATDEDYLTPRTHEHIYAEIVDKKVERHVKPTGSVRIVENERKVRVPIIRRLTRTFSINRRHGHGTRDSSSTIYRDRFSKLPKIPQEKEEVTCSCNKKILLCSVVVILIVLLLGVIAAVLLTMVLNKDNEPGKLLRIFSPTDNTVTEPPGFPGIVNTCISTHILAKIRNSLCFPSEYDSSGLV